MRLARWLLCLAGSALLTPAFAQPANFSWRAPVDASMTGCYKGEAFPALMDDGTLLVACVTPNPLVGFISTAPIWQRNPDGEWKISARPPSLMSLAIGIRKISGNKALFLWLDRDVRNNSFYRLQEWTAGSGAQSVIDIPFDATTGRPDLLPSSWGNDGNVVRVRSAKSGEIPGLPANVGVAKVIELVQRNGTVLSSHLGPAGRIIVFGYDACIWPNGDRLAVYFTRETSKAADILSVTQIYASKFSGKDGWGDPQFVFQGLAATGMGPKVFCAADGVARTVAGINGALRGYADLAGQDGWGPLQGVSSGSDAETSGELAFSRGNGRAVLTWNEYRKGLGTGQFTGMPGSQSIPRIHWLPAGGKYFIGDFSMPNYNADALDDTAVKALAWNPKRDRFVMAVIGGPAPFPKRMLVEFDPGGLWSEPIAMPGHMLEDWQLDSNAAGRGVLLAKRHGQLLISDWR